MATSPAKFDLVMQSAKTQLKTGPYRGSEATEESIHDEYQIRDGDTVPVSNWPHLGRCYGSVIPHTRAVRPNAVPVSTQAPESLLTIKRLV